MTKTGGVCRRRREKEGRERRRDRGKERKGGRERGPTVAKNHTDTLCARTSLNFCADQQFLHQDTSLMKSDSCANFRKESKWGNRSWSGNRPGKS